MMQPDQITEINGPKRVLCLMVTFNGESTVENSLRSIIRQIGPADKMMVIDNASSDDTIKLIQDCHIENLDLLVSDNNAGVGKAYNIGIQAALNQGFQWLCLFDQDTFCTDNYLKTLVEAGEALKREHGGVGVLFPMAQSYSFSHIVYFPYYWNGKKFLPVNAPEKANNEFMAVHSSISSGALYSVDALKETGGFLEEYFIDFIDHENHMKLYHAGYKNFWVTNSVVFHELGQAMQKENGEVFFVHKPWRYYYMGRNMTDGYWKLGGAVAVIIFWSDAWVQVKRLKNAGLFPASAFKYFIRGIKDAILRKFGPL